MRGHFPTRPRMAQCHFTLLAASWKKPRGRMAQVYFWGGHTKAQRGWKQQGREQTILNCSSASGIRDKTYLFLTAWHCEMKPSLLCATRLESFDITLILCLVNCRSHCAFPFLLAWWRVALCRQMSLPNCTAFSYPFSWGHFHAQKTFPKGQKASRPLPCTPLIMEILPRTCRTTTVGQVQEHRIVVNSA